MDIIPRCVICQGEGVNGIWLAGSLICQECEQKIVETDASDPKYCFYVEQLKKSWKTKAKLARQAVEDKGKLMYIKHDTMNLEG